MFENFSPLQKSAKNFFSISHTYTLSLSLSTKTHTRPHSFSLPLNKNTRTLSLCFSLNLPLETTSFLSLSSVKFCQGSKKTEKEWVENWLFRHYKRKNENKLIFSSFLLLLCTQVDAIRTFDLQNSYNWKNK